MESIIRKIEKLEIVKPIQCKICGELTMNFYSKVCNDCYEKINGD